jgi:hypothetical protein
MTLGAFLHTIHFPQKGGVMGGLAVSLMTLFLMATNRPALVPLLGIIAASFKPLDAFILGVPPWSPYIVNPAVAIILEALAFGAVVVVLRKAINRHLLARPFAGITAGYMGFIFYAVFASVFERGIWPTLAFSEKLNQIWTNATPIAIAGAFALILGYYVGKAGVPRMLAFKQAHSQMFYSAILAIVLACWIIPGIYQVGG